MKKPIVTIFLLIQILASCGITYKVRTIENALEEILFVPCGKLSVELVGRGDSKFFIRQRFSMKDSALIFSDSLWVFYNQKPVKLNFENEKLLNREILKIIGEEEIDARFELDDGVFDGDTIAIFAPHYIHCKGDIVSLDTIHYTFSNRLRIYGVNAL